MTRMKRLLAVTSLVLGVIGTVMALTLPANAATSHPASQSAVTALAMHSGITPDVNTFWACLGGNGTSSCNPEIGYGCNKGQENKYVETYYTGYRNNCEYKVYLQADADGGGKAVCVAAGAYGPIPAAEQYVGAIKIGNTGGAC
jgi:hypothetical protein